MLSRRDLVRNSLLLSTVAGLGPVVGSSATLPADIFVVEKRIQAASGFRANATTGATETLEFTSDPGPLWMHTLEPRLKNGPVAIGGFTSAPVLFCLHYLARDYGLTLAGLEEGAQSPASIARAPHTAADADPLVDLRDPRFSQRRAAYTWLLLPRKA